MTTWKLWAHSEVEESIISLDAAVRESVRRKVQWAEVQLACRGETTIMKGVQGHEVRWRRTPVKGNEYYLWWAKAGTKGFESLTPGSSGRDVFVRKVSANTISRLHSWILAHGRTTLQLTCHSWTPAFKNKSTSYPPPTRSCLSRQSMGTLAAAKRLLFFTQRVI